MPDQLGHDPHPTPPHILIMKSEALDRAIADDPVLATIAADGLRTRTLAKRTMTVQILMFVLGLIMVYALNAIANNASQLSKEKAARHVFCIETNVNNAQAQVALVQSFPNASDPAGVRRVAMLLFPIRDCSKDPPIVIGTVEIGNLPDPPPSTG